MGAVAAAEITATGGVPVASNINVPRWEVEEVLALGSAGYLALLSLGRNLEDQALVHLVRKTTMVEAHGLLRSVSGA